MTLVSLSLFSQPPHHSYHNYGIQQLFSSLLISNHFNPTSIFVYIVLLLPGTGVKEVDAVGAKVVGPVGVKEVGAVGVNEVDAVGVKVVGAVGAKVVEDLWCVAPKNIR